jgi:hypothetical protein
MLDIRRSLYNILADTTKAKKKYQNHLFRVLPQIYTGIYKRDPILLPCFVEKTEYNIRSGFSDYNLMKYDYYFLINIQNSNEGDTMENMLNSTSYKAGLLLGKLAQPLDYKIASFEKNYVGLLSRRIVDRQGLIKFVNFIDEKLTIHDVAYPNLKESSVALAKIIIEIKDTDYNKNYCAFGFFESYFKYEPKKEKDDNVKFAETKTN